MAHLPNIKVMLVDHHLQRYDTAGDYRDCGYEWRVIISKMKDWRMEALLLMHELDEMLFTKHHGISWDDIDTFDMNNPELDDPGACPKAPYHKEHMAAERLERMRAELLGVNWDEYNECLDALVYLKGDNQ